MKNLNALKQTWDLSKTPEQPTDEKTEQSAKLFKERFQLKTDTDQQKTYAVIPKISLKTVQGP